MNYLNVYAQPFWHGEAYLTGTIDGLKALRDALDDVIKANQTRALESMASDGEGYTLMLVPVAEEVFDTFDPGYTNLFSIEESDMIKGPWDLKIDWERVVTMRRK